MARKVVLSSGTVAYVEHVLADGTRLDTMEGYEIPYDEKHIPIMQEFFTVCDAILEQAEKRRAEKMLKEQEESK